ncbi:hypothetical protein E2562_027564, partial [Oryza meyeriana var. granulata]
KFVDSSKLKRHHLIHAGQKDFICLHPGCGKRSNRFLKPPMLLWRCLYWQRILHRRHLVEPKLLLCCCRLVWPS